jgi:hypothetical protein
LKLLPKSFDDSVNQKNLINDPSYIYPVNFSGGQFEQVCTGQFKSVWGGLFHRFLQ